VKADTSFAKEPRLLAANSEEEPGTTGNVFRLEIKKMPSDSSVMAVGTVVAQHAESRYRVVFSLNARKCFREQQPLVWRQNAVGQRRLAPLDPPSIGAGENLRHY
jgi:hypothetical protein